MIPTRVIILSAIFCLLMASAIPSLDWIQCYSHAGGAACRSARDAASAGWLGAGTSLFALAYQNNPRGPR